MNQRGVDFLSTCIHDLCKKDERIGFVKQNNVVQMRDTDFGIKLQPEGYYSFYHEFSSITMREAYEPFLSICRDLVKKNNIEPRALLDRVGVYPMQKSLFLHYFAGKIMTRDEELLVPEVEFEHKMFLKSLRMLLQELTKEEPVFLLLNKLNLAGSSTLKFLMELAEAEEPINMKIVCISNELGAIPAYARAFYKKVSEWCERQNMIYYWPYDVVDDDVEPDGAFIPQFDNMEEYNRCIQEMYYTMAYDQAEYYLSMMYQKLEIEKMQVPTRFRLDMIGLYVWVNILRGNNTQALLLCEDIKHIDCEEEYRLRKEFEYEFALATAYMYNDNSTEAQECALRCMDLSEGLKDEFLEFRSLLLYHMSKLDGWKDIWLCDKDIRVPESLIQGCKKHRYYNHLAHIYVYYFENDYRLYRVIEDLQDNIPHILMGIRMAEELGNTKFVMEAYRKNVMTVSYNGLFQASNYFYNKSLRVVKTTGDEVEEAGIYNGLGYNSCASDKFAEAHEYYCRALKLYYKHEMSDYIIETFYNMGMNCIQCDDYENAIVYLNEVLNMLTTLKRNSIRVCNISKIFGLLSLASFYKGDMYQARFYQKKSQQFLYMIFNDIGQLNEYLWDDDIFLYFLTSAMIDVDEKKYESAEENLVKAKLYVDRMYGGSFFNYPQFIRVKAMLYKATGDKKKFIDALMDGREKCNVLGNYVRVKQFDRMMDGDEEERSNLVLNLDNTVSIEEIRKFTRDEYVRLEAESRGKSIQFFSTFQELINRTEGTTQKYTTMLLNSVKSNFNLDHVIYIDCQEEAPMVRYSDLRDPLKNENVEELVRFFVEKPEGFAVSQLSNNYAEYQPIARLLGKHKIFSMFGVPMQKDNQITQIFIGFMRIPESWNSSVSRDILDEDDLQIFNFVFRQLVDALEKFHMNQQLRIQAETDQLTGLYNRKMYYNKMEELFRLAKRRKLHFSCAIIYADLDHFKSYNDTFGHSVGDAILVEFSRIFKKASEGKGFVIRFGGDEFIIAMNTSKIEDVKYVIDYIYKMIEEGKGFPNVVESITGAPVTIPKEQWVSCSIGVAMGSNLESVEAVAEIRQKADDALYRVKRNGRGYAEIVEEER